MGKDKAITKSSSNTTNNAPINNTTIDQKKIAKGHKQKGSGNVIVLSKPSVVTNDGVVIKSFEKLPCQILHEYCQKEKRSIPKYKSITPSCRYQITLEDAKNPKNNLVLSTIQSFDTDSIAKDYVALLALFHLQKNMPLERKLPEPYQTTWLQMIKNDKDSTNNNSNNNANKNSNDGKATNIKIGKDDNSCINQESIASKINSNNTTINVSNNKNASNINEYDLSNTSKNLSNNNNNNNKNHSNNSKANISIPELDRATADWLCDQCGVQNYNLLITGQIRMKCFRCQAFKSDTCQLVVAVSSTNNNTNNNIDKVIQSGSNNNHSFNKTNVNKTESLLSTTATMIASSNNAKKKIEKAVPTAILDLRATTPYTTVAEAEQQRLALRQVVLRKQRYFDALRRANRPMIINIPMFLRKTLENILGITSAPTTNNDNLIILNNHNTLLHDAITNYEEVGTFPEHLCHIPKNQQSSIVQKMCTELIEKLGFQECDVANTINDLCNSSNSTSLEDLLEDLIESTLQYDEDTINNNNNNNNNIIERCEIFLNLMRETCLKMLYISVDESKLPLKRQNVYKTSGIQIIQHSNKTINTNNNNTTPNKTIISNKISSDCKEVVVDTTTSSQYLQGSSSNIHTCYDSSSSILVSTLCSQYTLASSGWLWNDCIQAYHLAIKYCNSSIATTNTIILEEDLMVTMEYRLLFITLIILNKAKLQYLSLPLHINPCKDIIKRMISNECLDMNRIVMVDYEIIVNTILAEECTSLQAIFNEQFRCYCYQTNDTSKHFAYELILSIYINDDDVHINPFLKNIWQSNNTEKYLEKILKLIFIIYPDLNYPENPPAIYISKHNDPHLSTKNKDDFQVTKSLFEDFQPELAYLQDNLLKKANELIESSISSDSGMIYELYTHVQSIFEDVASSHMINNSIPSLNQSISIINEQLLNIDVSEISSFNIIHNIDNNVDRNKTSSIVSSSSAPRKKDTPIDEIVVKSINTSSTTTTATPVTALLDVTKKQSHNATNTTTTTTMMHSFWSSISNNPVKDHQKPNHKKLNTNVDIQKIRESLPARQSKEEFLHLIASSQAIVLTGETGCGKSTQIPQYLYEQSPNKKIVICQPRRLAAIGVALRVADEVGCTIGEEVGYMIKGDSKSSAATRILFCTYGVLLRRLQEDPSLIAVGTIILDEIHERGIDSDFALSLLMFSLKQRKDLKLILMSATISTEQFATYLKKELELPFPAPILNIPGKIYPVEVYYKNDYEEMIRGFCDYIIPNQKYLFDNDINEDVDELDNDLDQNIMSNRNLKNSYYIGGIPRKGEVDYDLLTKLIMVLANKESISNSTTTSNKIYEQATGTILVFMPGLSEIQRLHRLLEQHWKKSTTSPTLKIIPLHGNLSPSEQREVFIPVYKHTLKVVIATNVAEASITIPDVTVVIDSCRVKEMNYDEQIDTNALLVKFASQDSLRQRKGRAGRLQHGRCYRLITKNTFEKQSPAHSVPEILRMSLEQVVLQVKSLLANAHAYHNQSNHILSTQQSSPSLSSNDTIKNPFPAMNESSMSILSKCPDIPSLSSIEFAEQLLVKIQALDGKTGLLTPLGHHLSALPCLPRVGKLIIYGTLLGCIFPSTIIASYMTVKSPFLPSTSPSSLVVENKSNRVVLGSDRNNYYSNQTSLKSDYTIIVNISYEYIQLRNSKEKRSFCKSNGLSYERMEELCSSQIDFINNLITLGFLSTIKDAFDVPINNHNNNSNDNNNQCHPNRNACKQRLFHSIIYAGLYPNIVKVFRPPKRFIEIAGGVVERDLEAKELKFYINTNRSEENLPKDPRNFDIETGFLQRVFIHSSSINYNNYLFSECNYILYGQKQLCQTYQQQQPGYDKQVSKQFNDNKIIIKDITEITCIALLFFGNELQVDYIDGIVTIDNWMRVAASGRVVALIQEIRSVFNKFLSEKFQNPEIDISQKYLTIINTTCLLLDQKT